MKRERSETKAGWKETPSEKKTRLNISLNEKRAKTARRSKKRHFNFLD